MALVIVRSCFSHPYVRICLVCMVSTIQRGVGMWWLCDALKLYVILLYQDPSSKLQIQDPRFMFCPRWLGGQSYDRSPSRSAHRFFGFGRRLSCQLVWIASGCLCRATTRATYASDNYPRLWYPTIAGYSFDGTYTDTPSFPSRLQAGTLRSK